jgi:hypothetical protein
MPGKQCTVQCTMASIRRSKLRTLTMKDKYLCAGHIIQRYLSLSMTASKILVQGLITPHDKSQFRASKYYVPTCTSMRSIVQNTVSG